MPKRINRCPSCSSLLNTSELSCVVCNITIRGDFESCRFCRLSPEHQSYLETFLLCEGNLSRMEKILNLSYPTLRNKLTAALQEFGNTVETEISPDTSADSAASVETHRRALLEELSMGTITAEEAARALSELNRAQ